jgi:hypothetical protein
LSLALASLMIGTLDHSSWYIAYTGMLFGFSFIVGVRRPVPLWLWTVVLACGAPAVNMVARAAGTFLSSQPVWVDAGKRFMAAFAAILPGLACGCLFRFVADRRRGRLSQRSATT